MADINKEPNPSESNDTPASPEMSIPGGVDIPNAVDIPDEGTPPEPETGADKPASFNAIRAVQTILVAALLVASLFTLFTPSNLFSGKILDSMLYVMDDTAQTVIDGTPTSEASGQRIGIVSGHWKDTKNSGYVCSDDLTESKLNLQIATLVAQQLSNRGYQVDLLEENDPRLNGFKALALISIHNDSCEFISNDATGFKVAPALSNALPGEGDRLAQCLIDRYATATDLSYQTNKLTTDMTTYHSFNEVSSATTVVIIETGYMNLDRQILTQSTDLIVKGIVDGILCYTENQPGQEATATP